MKEDIIFVKSWSVKKLITIAIIFIGLLLFFYLQNNLIHVTDITIQSPKLSKTFDGYKVVHLSDLHGKSFGKNQKSLVKKIKDLQPDLIVFTGDLVDSRRYKEEDSIGLIGQITELAPVYYVTGNHEWRSRSFSTLEKALIDNHVHVLHNTFDRIKKDKDEIYILGVDDPSLRDSWMDEEETMKDHIEFSMKELPEEDGFKILLSHRPELFSLYSEYNIDLTFSGHAHGGQIRLPFIGGLVTPHQGFFPKYTAGMYTKNDAILIVSRGLGNSIFPQRIFNRPEIVMVTLKIEE